MSIDVGAITAVIAARLGSPEPLEACAHVGAHTPAFIAGAYPGRVVCHQCIDIEHDGACVWCRTVGMFDGPTSMVGPIVAVSYTTMTRVVIPHVHLSMPICPSCAGKDHDQ